MQKQNEEKMPDVSRQNWSAEKLAEESANEQPDEILRKVLRGNEEKGNADQRDIAGSANSDETPRGREEIKKQIGIEKNG